MTVRYLDPSTGRYIEGESVFDGRSLPGQEILDESCWRNSGSFRELILRSGNKHDWPKTSEMKGKAPGKSGRKQGGSFARPLTDKQHESFRRDRHVLPYRALARRYRISEHRTRKLINAMKKGAAA